ncbi:MAG: hypothetical protein WDO16_25295 [Bacteroidota bacterium]
MPPKKKKKAATPRKAVKKVAGKKKAAKKPAPKKATAKKAPPKKAAKKAIPLKKAAAAAKGLGGRRPAKPCICIQNENGWFCMKRLPDGSLTECRGPFTTREECEDHTCR